MHISTQGLVLREVNYKESDKLLTVLTAEGGKRTVKARGCRRKGSPRPPRPSSWSIRT
ncbi:MAG: recombination protein O N-terminal domain-containing protein [Flavonifractor plautii]